MMMMMMMTVMQDFPGGNINILGGHSIGHSKQENICVHMSYSERFPRELFHCTDEQHALSSHELQSALILMEFSKVYYTR
jgi:hypothetical protein